LHRIFISTYLFKQFTVILKINKFTSLEKDTWTDLNTKMKKFIGRTQINI